MRRARGFCVGLLVLSGLLPISLRAEPEEVAEEVAESVGIVGNVIRGLTGFVALEVEDLKYDNSITVYIERDFEGSGYEVGDLISLDPTLVVIENFSGVNVGAYYLADSDWIFVNVSVNDTDGDNVSVFVDFMTFQITAHKYRPLV